MKPNFTLNYDGALFNAASAAPAHTTEGDVYTFAPGVTVTLKAREFKEFDAAEWVLYFENTSEGNSKVFSDILDCNILLPLTFPDAKRPGFQAVKGDACVITMNGPVDGSYYGKMMK